MCIGSCQVRDEVASLGNQTPLLPRFCGLFWRPWTTTIRGTCSTHTNAHSNRVSHGSLLESGIVRISSFSVEKCQNVNHVPLHVESSNLYDKDAWWHNLVTHAGRRRYPGRSFLCIGPRPTILLESSRTWVHASGPRFDVALNIRAYFVKDE
jgi:hypothetical protein